MRMYRAFQDFVQVIKTLGLLGLYVGLKSRAQIRVLGEKTRGQLADFLRYRNARKDKKEYPVVAYDEDEVDDEAKALPDDEPLPECCTETCNCGGNGIPLDMWALHPRNFRGENGMKYELMVEYRKEFHPKMDAEIIGLAGKEPYDKSIGTRMRNLEFAYDDEKSYKAAYQRLKDRENVRVIGGNGGRR